jgi:hypothetical protein
MAIPSARIRVAADFPAVGFGGLRRFTQTRKYAGQRLGGLEIFRLWRQGFAALGCKPTSAVCRDFSV